MKRYLAVLIVLLLAPSITGCLDGESDEGGIEGEYLVEFAMNGTKLLSLNCELASTPEERAKGLMNRTELSDSEGMVFYYEPPREVSFWMKGTLIPLDMVFVSPEFIVVKVSQADPEPGVPDNELTRYPSGEPVRYVIEMNKGLAGENGVVAGTEVMVWKS
ncbi:MAG: DUF192 domain-containing protein [Thermoplasmatota archaeon]